MLSVTYKPFMLSLIMQNVVMLSVVVLSVIIPNVVMLSVVVLSILTKAFSPFLAVVVGYS